jgi:hypothetical protein
MSIEADIITETAMGFAVPSRAVVETDSSLYVLVLEKRKMEFIISVKKKLL